MSGPAAVHKPLTRLFVYGTLCPGQPNHYLLAGCPGTWSRGTVAGTLYSRGVGPTRGYPVVDLSGPAGVVEGHLLTSGALDPLWDRLDAFEGEGYRRVMTRVSTVDGVEVEAWIYALDRSQVKPADLASAGKTGQL